jgi:hypothetical protein
MFLAALCFAACIEPLSLENLSCPCTGGWKCCRANNQCIHNDEICPAGIPCMNGACEEGQLCHGDTCYLCDRDRYCGLECLDCTRKSSNWACLGDHCGCNTESDCPSYLVCRNGTCKSPKSNGGNGSDGGTYDASSDGSGGDGGGGDPAVYCTTARNCGSECIDCTRQETNWTCVWGRCGCYGDEDCAPHHKCNSNSCVPMDDSGKDGGI